MAVLVDALRAAGIVVWWDTQIPGAESWRKEITLQLDAASCVIVVWTEASVSPAGEFVHDEADRAKAKGVLLQVRLDLVSPPLGFGQDHLLDLVGWDGKASDPGFRNVVKTATAIAQGGTRPRPIWRRTKTRVSAGAIFFATIGVAGALTDAGSIQRAACSVPGVRGVCARFSWGGVPGDAEVHAWKAAMVSGNCSELHQFLDRFPNGDLAEATRLVTSRQETVEKWLRKDMTMSQLDVAWAARSYGTEEAAQADAWDRGKDDAQNACTGYSNDQFRRPQGSFDLETIRWKCERLADGYKCGFRATVVCSVEMRIASAICK